LLNPCYALEHDPKSLNQKEVFADLVL
jgi:hypothetical protein